MSKLAFFLGGGGIMRDNTVYKEYKIKASHIDFLGDRPMAKHKKMYFLFRAEDIDLFYFLK